MPEQEPLTTATCLLKSVGWLWYYFRRYVDLGCETVEYFTELAEPLNGKFWVQLRSILKPGSGPTSHWRRYIQKVSTTKKRYFGKQE
jgi:hypothetical protein